MEMSLEEILGNMSRRDSNFLEIINALQLSTTSKQDSVTLQWENPDGTLVSKTIPSISNLLNRVNSLERSVDGMTNISLRNPRVVLSNGEIRPIILAEPLQNPKIFSFPANITKYRAKESVIKDKFINPSITISVPISQEIYSGYKEFDYLKVIIGDDETSSGYFDAKLKDTIIDHATLIDDLERNDINYTTYSNTVKLGSKPTKDSGMFSIVNISKEKLNEESGIEVVYTLNTVMYKNSESRDLTLQSGQNLVFNKSVYRVVNINVGTRKVSLKLIEGSSPLIKGTNILDLQSEAVNHDIEIPIGNESRFLIFIKPINPNVNIVNDSWGSGNGIFLYSLVNFQNISYRDNFSENLWDSLLAVSEGLIKPASKILKPNLPNLENASFDVQIINKHKNQAKNEERLKTLQKNKTTVENNIGSIDVNIRSNRSELSSLDISNPANNNKNSELLIIESNMLAQREIYTKELRSISDEIIQISEAEVFFEPKYGVVGVIPFPEPRYQNSIDKSGKQDVIGLEVEYRYLSLNGVASEFDSNTVVTSPNVEERYSISRWIRHQQKYRQRDISGNFTDESISDPDVNSPNQYQIPISADEIVEIRARSVSDAGYPLRNITSDWSSSFKVEFPTNIIKNNNDAKDKAKSEKAKRDMADEFSRRNLEDHADDSFLNKNKKFKHSASNIATEEKTPEQGNKDVQAVLNEMRSEIASLSNILNSSKGFLQVRLLDSNDTQLAVVKNNSIVPLESATYSELIKNEPTLKGTIINQKYFIEITNTSDGELELLSYITGNTNNPLREDYDGYTYNNVEYSQFRKQYLVPIVFNGIKSNDFDINTFGGYFQNKQVQAQSVYSRYRDVGLDSSLYEESANGQVTPVLTGSIAQPFIWAGHNNITGGGYESDFAVHLSHPDLPSVVNSWSDFNISDISRKANWNSGSQTYLFCPFIHTECMSRDTKTANWYKHLAYKTIIQKTSGATVSDAIPKMSFEPNDRYLIGKKTCGVYLTLAPETKETIGVDNSFYNTGQKIAKGQKIVVPILTSSRLTDYFGDGDTGTGRIGGYGTIQNIRYEKKLGLDILIKSRNETNLFSFDIKYGIQYKNSNI
jgi:hypothetical protein